jgi:hypothetical protein
MIAVVMASLAVLSVVLFAVGADRNSQIDSLKQHGRVLSGRVTGCLGLLGGSGSNDAGYDCSVEYTVTGHHNVENLPDTIFRRPGSVVPAVIIPSGPALIDTATDVTAESASSGVFILPTVVLIALLLGAGTLIVRRRPKSTRSSTGPVVPISI